MDKKTWIWLLVAVIVLGIGYWYYMSQQPVLDEAEVIVDEELDEELTGEPVVVTEDEVEEALEEVTE